MRDYYAATDGPSETKEEQRQKIAADVAAYTGTVQVIPRGVSGYTPMVISNRGDRIRERTRHEVDAAARDEAIKKARNLAKRRQRELAKRERGNG
jgi:hypothetical protein